MRSRIVLEPPRLFGEAVELAGTFYPGDDAAAAQRLWWRIAPEWQSSLSRQADPFAIAFVFPMMIAGRDTLIEGAVSPSLLRNLETFMTIWNVWFPERYRRLEITASEEREAGPPAVADQAIMPFSCGVDSSFTAFRHARRLIGRRSLNLRAGVVIHGFGMTLHRPHSAVIYQGILNSSRTMLRSLGLDCIPISTNFQDLPMDWFHSHGTQLVAALSLLSAKYDTGLIGNSINCRNLERYHGSNPYTDPLLSSRNFPVVDDGAELLRYEKIKVLSEWPEAMQYLRVCLNPQGNHLNCCRCEKCILTMLAFRVAGAAHPPAFPINPTDRALARMRITRGAFPMNWKNLVAAIYQHKLHTTSWFKAVRAARRRNKVRDCWNDLRRPLIPVRNLVRRAFRGSPLARSQRGRNDEAGTSPH